MWRQITQYAIKKRLFSRQDCIEDTKDFGIQDDPRNQSKPKDPLSLEDEDKLLEKCDENNDDFWGDCFAIAIDTGVRHDGELNR